MRNSSALSRTLEKFTHSDFDLPILLSLEQRAPSRPAARRVPLPCRERGARRPALPRADDTQAPVCTDARQNPPDRIFPSKIRAVGLACVVHHTPILQKMQVSFHSPLPCFDGLLPEKHRAGREPKFTSRPGFSLRPQTQQQPLLHPQPPQLLPQPLPPQLPPQQQQRIMIRIIIHRQPPPPQPLLQHPI